MSIVAKLLELFESHINPDVAFGIAIGLIIALCYYIKSKINVIDKTANTVETLSKSVHTLDRLVARLDRDIAMAINTLLSAKSPLDLNDIGRRVSAEIHGESIVTNNLNKIKGLIRKEHLENPYDLQDECFFVFRSFEENNILSKEQINEFKKVAYNNGVTLSNILAVLAVILAKSLLNEKNDKGN